jgi:rhodanese-related sulfurtransferase
LVILAVGVRPNVELARQVGADLGPSGAIKVDASMRTSVPDVFAVGDCAESFSVITGASLWRPLGSTANKMGRIAGEVITGGTLEHRGILGTGILRVFELGVAYTGLTETEARAQGFDTVVLHNLKPAHAAYLGGRQLVIKAVADRATGRLLGAQAIGPEGADKRIDVLATAITFGAKAEDLFHLDLAYSPPFATTKDPVHYTGMALDTAIRGRAPLITPAELDARAAAGVPVQIIDVRSGKDFAKSSVPGAVHIPLKELRQRLTELDPALPTVTYCNSGVSGNAGQNVLLAFGFADVSNLPGGKNNYQTHLRELRAHHPAARADVS